MTNFRPFRPTQKLPEYGDRLFALQTNPVCLRGMRGPFWNLSTRAHSNPATPRPLVLSSVLLADTSGYMSPWRQFCRRYRIHVDCDKGYKWIQLVSGRHVSGVDAALCYKVCLDCWRQIVQMFFLSLRAGHPKVIPCTAFEYFGIIRFWVIVRTDTHHWRCSSVVERRSLTGELSLVCIGPAADW